MAPGPAVSDWQTVDPGDWQDAGQKPKTAGRGKTGVRLKGDPETPPALRPLESSGMTEMMGNAQDPDLPVGQRASNMLGVMAEGAAPGLYAPMVKAGMDSVPGQVLGGAVKGGLKEAFSPVQYGMHRLPVPKSVAGAMAGRFAGELLGPVGSKIGGALGAVAPFAEGAMTGGRAALAEAQAARAAQNAPPRTPVWEGMPPPETGLPAEPPPMPPPGLPSGRVPGPAPAKPPVVLPSRMPMPTPETLPDIPPAGSGIKDFQSAPQTTLPSGRVPGKPTQGQQSVPFEPVAKTLGKKVIEAQQGSVVVPPAEGVPERYNASGQAAFERQRQAAFQKDQAIAQALRGKITPQEFDAADDAQLASWQKSVNPKYSWRKDPQRRADLRALLFGEGEQ